MTDNTTNPDRTHATFHDSRCATPSAEYRPYPTGLPQGTAAPGQRTSTNTIGGQVSDHTASDPAPQVRCTSTVQLQLWPTCLCKVREVSSQTLRDRDSDVMAPDQNQLHSLFVLTGLLVVLLKNLTP